MKTGHCNIYKTENVPPETVSVPDNTLDPAECVQKLGPQVNEVLPGWASETLRCSMVHLGLRPSSRLSNPHSGPSTAQTSGFSSACSAKLRYNVISDFRHVEVLKQLRENELFALAQACTPEYYIDGQDIVTQGDEGNTFYFIEDGRVDVIVSDHKVAELSSNSYFGEAALLNNAPRNATCRSVEKQRLPPLTAKALTTF